MTDRTDQDIKQRSQATQIDGGTGSEHLSDTEDLKRIEKQQAQQRSTDEADGPGEAPVRTSATSYTEMDEQAAEEGERGLAARTAQEMSQHDELSRTPTPDRTAADEDDTSKQDAS